MTTSAWRELAKHFPKSETQDIWLHWFPMGTGCGVFERIVSTGQEKLGDHEWGVVAYTASADGRDYVTLRNRTAGMNTMLVHKKHENGSGSSIESSQEQLREFLHCAERLP